jgi:hypothetical protein
VRARAGAVALGVAVALGLAEGGLRGWGWPSPAARTPSVLRMEAPSQSLEPRVSGLDGRTYRVSTDVNGLRAPLHPERKPPGLARVLALGCGLTFGEGVDDPYSYPARLEAHLLEGGHPVQVVNAGQARFTTVAATWAWDRVAIRYQPDVVVAGLLLEDAAPAERSDRSNAARAAEPEFLRERPWYRSRLVVLTADALESLRTALPGTPAGRRVPLYDYARALAGLHRRAADAGARLVFLVPPGADATGGAYRAQVHHEAERLGVPMLDLAGGSDALPQSGGSTADADWYDAIAKAVAQFLVANRLVP